MNILITGHKGLIGSDLYNNHFKNDTLYGYDKGDSIPDVRFDMIIHCAANCIIREVINNPALAKENIDITYEMLELARKYKSKFIYFSSSRVEHELYNSYIASKRAGEELVKAYSAYYNFPYIIIRPETVWGINDNPKRVIPLWINNAKKGEDIIIYGDKYKELSPIYVKDFNGLFLEVINNDYSTISISGTSMNVEEIVNIILNTLDSESRTVYKNPELLQPQVCIPASVISNKSFKERIESIYGPKEC